jgi:hypothetical protein
MIFVLPIEVLCLIGWISRFEIFKLLSVLQHFNFGVFVFFKIKNNDMDLKQTQKGKKN